MNISLNVAKANFCQHFKFHNQSSFYNDLLASVVYGCKVKTVQSVFSVDLVCKEELNLMLKVSDF